MCVRYRYDFDARRRVTAVEIVVDDGAWTPSPQTEVGVQVRWGEADLARRVKRAGGQWDRRRKVWRLPFGQVQRLGLEDRQVPLRSHQMKRPSLHIESDHQI